MTRSRHKLHKVQFRVGEGDAGRRLDQVLAAHVPDLSRRKARVLLDIGGVFVDRKRVKVASRSMAVGQLVEAHLGGAFERATKSVGRDARTRDARALPAHRVVYEDGDIAVVDKPAGLLSAPTPESDRGNLVDALRRESGGGHVFVVHRIDLGTSGLLVFAKTRRANKHLSERFRSHDIDREYIAVVSGGVVRPATADDRISVKLPIKGKRAATHFRIDEVLGDKATIVRARLETGRTHQIRIHCRHLGHAVLGDTRYGTRTPHDPPRMALHAAVLGFEHPRTEQPLAFESPLPDALATWIAGLRQSIVPGETS